MPKLLSGIFVVTAAAFAQTSPPQFEVATIKPAADLAAQFASGKGLHVGMKVDGARVDIGAMSLADLIRIAYKVKQFQVSGPDWMTTQRWDVLARIPEGVSKDQVPEMLQALLAERFRLAIHRDTKNHSEYALVVAKGGIKMKEAPAEPEAPPAADGTAANNGNAQLSFKADGKGAASVSGPMGNVKVSPGPDGIHYEFGRMTMPAFADTLSQLTNLPVVDMTDLKGSYEVAFDIPMADLIKVAQAAGFAVPGAPPAADAGAPVASDPSSGNAIFNNVQKLGLKLEPRKAPVEMIVVDHLEKSPTEN